MEKPCVEKTKTKPTNQSTKTKQNKKTQRENWKSAEAHSERGGKRGLWLAEKEETYGRGLAAVPSDLGHGQLCDHETETRS